MKMKRIKLNKFYENKKILVTGATGFKGAWLISWLLKFNSKLYGISSKKIKRNSLFYKLNLHKKIKISYIDIRNFNKLNDLIDKIKPSIIFHFASKTLIYKSYKNPYLTFDVNFRGTLNLLECLKQKKYVKSVIITTSDKCYENKNTTKGYKESDLLGGDDPYSASKTAVEFMVKSYKEIFLNNKRNLIGISTVRSGNVIGGGDWSKKRLIPDIIRSLLKNKLILIRNPNFNRPWQHVLEPLKGYLILAKKQYENPLKYSSSWNFGTKINSLINVKKMVKLMINYWGKGKFKIKKNNFYEQPSLQLNIYKSKKFLGWEPTYNIKKSLKFTKDWYQKVYQFFEDPEEITSIQINKYMYDSKIY